MSELRFKPGDKAALIEDMSYLPMDDWSTPKTRPAGTILEFIEYDNRLAVVGIRKEMVKFRLSPSKIRPLSPLEQLADVAE